MLPSANRSAQSIRFRLKRGSTGKPWGTFYAVLRAFRLKSPMSGGILVDYYSAGKAKRIGSSDRGIKTKKNERKNERRSALDKVETINIIKRSNLYVGSDPNREIVFALGVARAFCISSK